MFKNYLKITLRNIRRHTIYSLINTFGLSVGMAACLLTIDWWKFLLAGILALVIALLTVSFLSTRSATANPVDRLRYE